MLESVLKEILDVWYEMPKEAQQHLFGDAVENIYCGIGYFPNNGVIELNWNEYELPKMASMVVVFKNGKILSINTGMQENVLLRAEGV